MIEPAAQANVLGTAVILAAAGRSSGLTTAMTYDALVGTSICDSALRASNRAMAAKIANMLPKTRSGQRESASWSSRVVTSRTGRSGSID